MKLSTSQSSGKFKRVSNEHYIINTNLVYRQKVSPEDVIRIVNLQNIRKYFHDFMEILDNKEEIKRLDKIVTQIEFQLQKLWGLDQDERMHFWFKRPKCSCPKSDNSDVIGTDIKYINSKCILHA